MTVLLLALSALSVWAEEPLVARMEWDFQGFKLQQAIVFRDEDVEILRNSNFVCGPASRSETVALGAVRLPYDEGLTRARNSLRQIAARAPAPRDSLPPPRKHEARTFIGARDIGGHEAYGPTVTRIVEGLCARFKATHEARVSAPPDFKEAGCVRTRRPSSPAKGPETWACPFPERGWAWFSR